MVNKLKLFDNEAKEIERNIGAHQDADAVDNRELEIEETKFNYGTAMATLRC